jgi:hypothetical protein
VSDGCGKICEAHFLLSRNGNSGLKQNTSQDKTPRRTGTACGTSLYAAAPATEDGLNAIAPDEAELSQRPSAVFATPADNNRKPAPSGRRRGLTGATDLAAFV